MLLPSWLRWYKKPEYRDIKEYSTAVGSGKRAISPDGRNKCAIPSRLKLERVLQNKTCSPMSLYDFYMYLKYIEYSSENLEFYIWFKNYEKAYAKLGSVDEKDNQSVTESESSLDKSGDKTSPVNVTDFGADPEVAREALSRITALISSTAACSTTKKCNSRYLDTCVSPAVPNSVHGGTKYTPNWAPNPPYPTADSSIPGPRAELNAIIDTFLLPDSPKELNIPPSMRSEALNALQTSSSPTHLKPIADHVYLLLRNCSHRNFVRLGVSNGTLETICVATGLGLALTAAGFLCVLLRALTPRLGAHSSFDAFGAWPLWFVGVSLVLSGLRGSCFFLLLFSRRQPLPWERFDDNASILSGRSGVMKAVRRLMIFDRKMKVSDVHLRRLQRKIVWQSMIGGFVFASVGVLFFKFLPIWRQTVRT